MANHLKLTLTIVYIFISCTLFAQIKGKVTNISGQPISGVSIRIHNSYIGTSSNKNGEFELPIQNTSNIQITFQSLGFKSERILIEQADYKKIQNITLQSIEQEIEEIVITTKGNPADRIIKNAIKNKKKNSNLHNKYEVDFYSKGALIADKLPKRLLGVKIDSTDAMLDKSKIIYLSETVSKVKVNRPNEFFEEIIATKVSGDSKGLSFNRATNADYDLYQNYTNIENKSVISPISDIAFNYYNYRLEQSFEEENQKIFKIKMTPKRISEPVYQGYIYIVDDTWEIYATDLILQGSSINSVIIDTLKLKQQFGYHQKDKRWSKNMQNLDLRIGILGLEFTGQFTYLFTNYNYVKDFEKNTFSRIKTVFDKSATQKDSLFWDQNRQIALTTTETKDYEIKDSIEVIRKAKRDSTALVNQDFTFKSLYKGYTRDHDDSKFTYRFQSPISLKNINFNTVQGLNINSQLLFSFTNKQKRTLSTAEIDLGYGFKDKNVLASGSFLHQFNNNQKSKLSIEAGRKLQQFHNSPSLSPILNTVYSLLVGENYMKFYQNDFAQLGYSQYLHPNFRINTNLAYNKRSNAYNHTTYSFVKDHNYTSNNPLDPEIENTIAFANHQLVKAEVSLDIYFKTSLEQLPDRLVYYHNSKAPKINIKYQNALWSSINDYEYQKLEATISQQISLGNKGLFKYLVNAGTFMSADNISFVDFKHVNANQTQLALNNNMPNSFMNLPYYSYSTNKNYIEAHAEHNFQGFILNKIPLLNKLKLETIVGYHLLSTENRKPYQEFSIGLNKIGWGKYKILRIDYVRSINGNHSPDAFVFGLAF